MSSKPGHGTGATGPDCIQLLSSPGGFTANHPHQRLMTLLMTQSSYLDLEAVIRGLLMGRHGPATPPWPAVRAAARDRPSHTTHPPEKSLCLGAPPNHRV